MSRKVIIITDLDVWMLTRKMAKPGMGNQVMYNTLLGFARAGYEVHMLTTSTALAGMPPIDPKVFIHRAPLRLYEAYRSLKSVPGRIARLFRPRQDQPAPSRTKAPPREREWTFARMFRRVMGRRAVRLARQVGGVEFVYGYEVQGALAGEEAAKALGVPLVTRFQGTEMSQFLHQPDRLMAYKTHVAALRADADLVVMANDGTLGDAVLDFLGVPRHKYRFYMDGVVKDQVYRPDVDAAAIRRRLGIADHEVFILYTGRMFYWKRIDRHMEVLARVAREFPDFKAAFIGDGPEGAACRALCTSLGLDGRVLWLGAMPHAEVMDYLNACDVYISFHDLTNLCNPAIEACVCAKCIVTTAVGGICDLLTDGVNAVVIPRHDDLGAIAAGLLRVLRDPAERARLAEGARRRGQELKTWEERIRMEIDEIEKAGKR